MHVLPSSSSFLSLLIMTNAIVELLLSARTMATVKKYGVSSQVPRVPLVDYLTTYAVSVDRIPSRRLQLLQCKRFFSVHSPQSQSKNLFSATVQYK